MNSNRISSQQRPFIPRLILSYPRSGNTFLRLLIEYLDGGATHYIQPNNHDAPIYTKPGAKEYLGHVDPARLSGVKAHFLADVNNYRVAELVTIVRDPVEAIVRQMASGATDLDQQIQLYQDVVDYHEGFAGPKLLVNYEGLMTDLPTTVHELARFLGADPGRAGELVNQADEIRTAGIAAYKNLGESMTRGRNLHFHRYRADPAIVERVEASLGGQGEVSPASWRDNEK